MLTMASILAVAVSVLLAADNPAKDAKPARDTKPAKDPEPRDVTLTGKVMDLHSYMTGAFKPRDKARCVRTRINTGVPAGIETKEGFVLIGQGGKRVTKIITPLAYQRAELKGRLYVKGGVRYIDVTEAKLAPPETGPEDQPAPESKPEAKPAPDEDEPEMEEPRRITTGACCLPSGDCIDTKEDTCFDRDGEFYADELCEDVDCTPSES